MIGQALAYSLYRRATHLSHLLGAEVAGTLQLLAVLLVALQDGGVPLSALSQVLNE